MIVLEEQLLWKECKVTGYIRSCLVSEYADLEESFSPMVLDDMTAWISATTGLKKWHKQCAGAELICIFV